MVVLSDQIIHMWRESKHPAADGDEKQLIAGDLGNFLEFNSDPDATINVSHGDFLTSTIQDASFSLVDKFYCPFKAGPPH